MTDEQLQDEPVDDMRADFAASIDALESGEVASQVEDSPAEEILPTEAEENGPASLRSESEEAPSGELEIAEAGDSGTEPAQTNEQPDEKPPIGWKAQEREVWKDVPTAARNAVLNREKEIAQLMQHTSGERRTAKQFADSMMPFRQTLEGMGYADPFTAVRETMGAVTRMRAGSVAERANAAADIIKRFDIDITALDDALSDGHGLRSQSAELETLLDQRLAPVNNYFQQQQAQQAQYQEQGRLNAQNEVAGFTQDKEFIQDVRMEMADMMDAASARGQTMGLQEAYDRACQLNPQVQAVINQRTAPVAPTRQDIERKRAAASSITGRRGGVGAARPAESIEDALRSAWDSHTTG